MRLAVSFSGGRDSLVVLHQAIQEDPNIPVVFVDTTITLPESLEYIKWLADEWGLNLHIYKPRHDFWWWLERKKIWPTKNMRWCLTKLKEQPFRQARRDLNLDGYITGLRRKESLRRHAWAKKSWHKISRYWLINPILDWSHEDVRRYIKKHNLPINPCYKLYGWSECWYCPYMGKATAIKIYTRHPEFAEKIMEYEKRIGASFYFHKKVYISELLKQTTLHL